MNGLFYVTLKISLKLELNMKSKVLNKVNYCVSIILPTYRKTLSFLFYPLRFSTTKEPTILLSQSIRSIYV